MAKNSLNDFRDHLFLALERLGDEDLTTEELERECKRSEAICEVAARLTDTLKVEADIIKTLGEPSNSNMLRTTTFCIEHDKRS